MSKNEVAEQAAGTEVVDQETLEQRQKEIEEKLRQQVATVNERTTAPSQNKISVDNKKFTFPGGDPQNGPLHCVILDSIWVMAHYPAAFNRNNPQDPNCFAIGRVKPDSGELTPHETSPEPQSDDCASCPKNEWGSDPQGGRGKACKNQKRLLIVPPDFDENTVPFTLYVSPGALKRWDGYERELASVHKLDPIQVVTVVDFDPNAGYPSLTFKFREQHDKVLLAWDLRERYRQVTEHVFEIRDRK